MRKMLLCLTALLLGGLSVPAAANATCTIDQRVALAKAGYEKSEIEAMCGQVTKPAPVSATAVEPLPGGLDLLNNGSIVGSSSADYAKRRCRIGQDGVWFKKKGLVPLAATQASAKRKINPDGRTILIVISLDTGFNSDFCLITRVDNWRYPKGDMTAFNADAEKFQSEYDAILRGLEQRGVRMNK
jgi:hypothetical protein